MDGLLSYFGFGQNFMLALRCSMGAGAVQLSSMTPRNVHPLEDTLVMMPRVLNNP